MHPSMLTEEQIALKDAARKLALGEFRDRAARWDREGIYPEENHHRLAALGYLGMTIPEEFGGSGLGVSEAAAILGEIHHSGGNAGAGLPS